MAFESKEDSNFSLSGEPQTQWIKETFQEIRVNLTKSLNVNVLPS